MKTRRGRRESQREARRSGEAKPRIWLNPTTTTTKMRCSACANLRTTLMLCPLHPCAWTTTKTKELLLNTLLAYDPLHALERRIVCLQLPLLNHQLLRICPRSASSLPKSLFPPLALGRRSSSCTTATVPMFESHVIFLTLSLFVSFTSQYIVY